MRHHTVAVIVAIAIAVLFFTVVRSAPTVPTDIQQPGTQTGEFGSFATNCSTCHWDDDPDPLLANLPENGWNGSMMSHAMRDPIFWATVAIAEQDFLPNADPALRGGAGDLCLRCHGPAGWLAGRSTPTDGADFTGDDERGVECEFCHLMVDPDEPLSLAGTTEVQNAPFLAHDATTGEGWYGSGMFVLNGGGTRLGPYDDASANHAWMASPFVRDADFCGTCHDVSNAAVGDLAHNNGAQVALAAGTFSGVPGSPVAGKAAFNNPPYAYGVVERTFSEYKVSDLSTTRVADFATLPADLKVAGGALEVAYSRATATTVNGDYADGAPRYFTCQTCHMAPVEGKGCNKNNAPVRADMPRHDMVGGGYWMPDVVEYQADNGLLRFGTLTAAQRAGMADGKLRAEAHLRSAGSVTAQQNGDDLVVRVTNLTAHKLISGYPEGRRMWLNIRYYDALDALIEEDGGYGPIGRNVQDLDGDSFAVESLLDLDDTIVFDVEPGMTREWANQLLALGYDTNLALGYDRDTDAVTKTLGQLGAEPPDSAYKTFHFAINNTILHDTRIPPYGFDYDDALERNSLPVPADQFGNPGAGGVYDYWFEEGLEIPTGAVRAEVRLFYQQTSWEYVQFLWLANDGLTSFLSQEGVNMLDAWLNTGMSAPFEMTMTALDLNPVAGAPGEASHGDTPSEHLLAAWNPGTTMVDVAFTAACDASDHTIYYGPLSAVGSYGWTGAACAVGSGGSASFDPGTGSSFFVIVGNDSTSEGSYGLDSNGDERPEDLATAVCDRAQDLGGTCDLP